MIATRIRTRLAGENGAVAVLVVALATGLFGMVALTVDGGQVVALRRRLVTVADAAALAAAQSCARGEPADARDAADRIAAENMPDAERTAYVQAGCGALPSGTVTVTYRSETPLTFAPVIGLGSSQEVTATATAIWGPARGAGPAPIQVSLRPDGTLPCSEQPIGGPCAYWWDNSLTYGIGDSSSWGFLSLDGWDVPLGSHCPNPGSSRLRDWITGKDPRTVTLPALRAALVCITSGHKTDVWFDALASYKGSIKHFPVNDPAQMDRSTGREKYAIVGFVALRIEDVLRGDDPKAVGPHGACGKRRKDANAVCLVASWQGAQIGGTSPGPGLDSGLRAIRLAK